MSRRLKKTSTSKDFPSRAQVTKALAALLPRAPNERTCGIEGLSRPLNSAYGIPRTSRRCAASARVVCSMLRGELLSDTQIRIAPIVESLSLKAKAYAALKSAILRMNI